MSSPLSYSRLSPDMPPAERLISLRHHKKPCINQFDFYAIQGFERLHPELYLNATTPKQTNNFGKDVTQQMNAFNQLFRHPSWSEEFKGVIAKAKQFSEAYDKR